MDIKRSCASSPLIDNIKSASFSSQDRPPSIFSNESNADSTTNIYALNFSPIVDTHTSSFDEQIRLERDIAHKSSILTEDSFTTTYSSLQTILSQMQLKLSSVYLQETEYLQQREQRLEQDEQFLTQRIKQLKTIKSEREQMEKDFLEIKDRLEMAVIQVTKFKTNGTEILRKLFSESHQIDEQLSALISQSTASLLRSRFIVNSRTNEFLEKSDNIQSELTDREILINNAQSSIKLMVELVNTLNQLNIEHLHDVTITTVDFNKQYQDFIDISETINNKWDIKQEMEQIRLLENEKIQMANELLEDTILLENIYTILGKAIII